MRMPPALPPSAVFPTPVNRTGKRVRLAIALALIAIAAGVVVASASSGALGSLLFGGSQATGGTVEHSRPFLSRNSVVATTLAASPSDGQLNSARRGHTATLLSDGKVLVAGGENSSGVVTAAEIFDPALGSFSVSGNLSTPRADHTATRLSDGHVLIAGGRGELGPLSSTEIFDPTTGAFTAGPDLVGARSGHTATTLGDGRIVLAGGDATGSLEVYDPVSNAFVLEGPTMLTPRAMHSAALMSDGRILFVGGNNVSGNGLQSAEIFNPVDTSLSATGSGMEHDRVHAFLRVLHDGKIQVIGGTDDDAIEIYDPAADAFGAHGHLIPVDDPHAALLRDDILNAPTRAALFHNGQADSLLDRSSHTITELSGSTQALVAGGANSDGSVLNSALLLGSSAATISTDKLDYSPSQTALITGTGWQPGETVDVVMHEDPHTHTERRLSLVADSEGKIIGSYFVEQHDSNVHFVVGAKGLTSGRTAQTAFTDTDPTPQPIPYSQDFSALPHSSTTYPAGWQGWQLSTSGSSTSFRTSAATGDLALNANSSASTATGGVHNYNGEIGILATGSSDPSLALAIDTTGHSNVKVSFDIMTIRNPHDGGSNTRINQADLQYRVGTTGSFTSVSGLANGIYQNNTTTQTGAGVTTPQKFESKSFILPSAVDNQAVVQLRWVQRDVSGSGSRPSFAVDNIAITVVSAGSLQFSAANYNDLETNSGTHTKTITVQRTGGSGGAVDVSYGTSDGTATLADNDYLASSGTLHWNEGDSADRTFTVTVKGDTTYETNETVNLTLSAPTGGAVIGGTNPTTLTIQNDDTAPAFSIDDVTHNESNTGTTSYDFTVSLSNASYQTVTVDYATANDTATASSDYAAVPTTTLTFLPGETSKQVNVSANGDTTFEDNENFFVNLSNETNATIFDGQGVGTIQNDDSQPTISIGDKSQAEGNAVSANFDFAVTLSNPSDQTITVHYSTADGTATQPGDYTSTSGTLTFVPGDTSETVSVSVNGDTTFEGDETFMVNLDTPTNSTILDGTGLGTIQNDDSQPTISIGSKSQAEGNAVSANFDFAVTLSNPSDQTITVHYSTADGTATQPGDYTSTSGIVTFVPGDTSETVSVSVNGDTTFEGGETFTVNLDSPTNSSIADGTGLGTIQNDDSQPTVEFALGSSSGAESASSVNLTVNLSNGSFETVTVNYTVNVSSTATGSGVDYTLLGSGTLTFSPGDTSENVSLTVNDDTLDEFDETVVVDLSTPTNATLGTPSTHTYTTQDNDAAPTVQFSAASSAGAESASPVDLAVNLSAASGKTVTVNYALNASSTATGGGVDYTLASGTLTFNPGDDTSKNVTLTVNDDNLDENDETVVVNLSTPSNATLGSPATHTYTIQDNDSAPVFTISDVTLAEGNSGTTDFIFTVTKTGPTALTATVDFATANGTTNPATGGVTCGAGFDYESKIGTLTFAPADTTMMVTIRVCGDITSEANETFFVYLSNATNATISDNQGLGMITNDDNVTYNFEGFFNPVDNPPIVNTVKAGSAVPVKWRLTAGGAPVSAPNSFVGLFSYAVNCGTTDGLESPIETLAPGGSALQYQGNGNWQINWNALSSYPKGSCRVMELRLNDGTSHYANFKFK